MRTSVSVPYVCLFPGGVVLFPGVLHTSPTVIAILIIPTSQNTISIHALRATELGNI